MTLTSLDCSSKILILQCIFCAHNTGIFHFGSYRALPTEYIAFWPAKKHTVFHRQQPPFAYLSLEFANSYLVTAVHVSQTLTISYIVWFIVCVWVFPMDVYVNERDLTKL